MEDNHWSSQQFSICAHHTPVYLNLSKEKEVLFHAIFGGLRVPRSQSIQPRVTTIPEEMQAIHHTPTPSNLM